MTWQDVTVNTKHDGVDACLQPCQPLSPQEFGTNKMKNMTDELLHFEKLLERLKFFTQKSDFRNV